MSKKILITGATGNIASHLIPNLLQSGASVRGLVRSPGKAAALEEAGMEIAVGDFMDSGALDNAMVGIDTVFLITATDEFALEQAGNVLAAAKRAGNPRIVRVSALKPTKEGPTDNSRQHFETDREIYASGMPYTIIRPNFYMQNLFMAADTIAADGVMYWGMGDARIGMIDARDIADFAFKILTDEGHDGKTYTITGPTVITFHEAAKALSAALGKNVTYVPVPLEAVSNSMFKMGMGEWFAEIMTDYSKAFVGGWGDDITDDFQTVTGNPPRSISMFASEIFAPALGG